jgi:hypothetical protein
LYKSNTIASQTTTPHTHHQVSIAKLQDARLRLLLCCVRRCGVCSVRKLFLLAKLYHTSSNKYNQTITSSVDNYPQTSYLKQTNSLGVVTGMPAVFTSQPSAAVAITSQPGQPAVVTSQPAVVTSQPLPAEIPAVGPGLHTFTLPGTGSMFNQTRTIVVSANNSTTMQIQTSTPVASGSGSAASGSGARASGSGSATRSGAAASQSANAANNMKVAAGSILGFGAFVAAIL